MYIKNLAQLRKQDMKIAGGKAVFLGEMIKAKFLVPEGFVILASAFKLCKNSYEIEDDVTDEILANFDNLNSSVASIFSIGADPPDVSQASNDVGLIVMHFFASVLFTVANAFPA